VTTALHLGRLSSGTRVDRNVALAPYTSLRVGGRADLFAITEEVEGLRELVGWAAGQGIPWRVIGRGSNLVIADRGFRGLIIRMESTRLTIVEEDAGALVTASAGTSLAHLARETAARGWTGFEFAAAIPGTLGGAVVQNAGAHAGDMRGVLRSARVLRDDGSVDDLPLSALDLSYRDSALKRASPRPVVVEATFVLKPSPAAEALARIDEIRHWRREHQPTEMSAGSTFTNPPGEFAGRLIERAGLKGRAIGGAAISTRHANFIVNQGGASAEDVASLICLARSEVERRFGIALVPEVEFLGDWSEFPA